jgi:UDPglucose--hexose-1-phosphate uridylyltransferase
VRVFPNAFPVVNATGADGATGACEVIVFAPEHDQGLEDLEPWHVEEVLAVIQARVAAMVTEGHSSPQVFVNAGGGSGASIAHPHAQLIALDFLPPAVQAELDMVERRGARPH